MTLFKKTMLASALMAAPFISNAGVYNLSANNASQDAFHGVFTVTVDANGTFRDHFRFNLDNDASFGAFVSSFDLDNFTSIVIDGITFGTTASRSISSLTHNIAQVSSSLMAGTHSLAVTGNGMIGDQYTLDLSPLSAISPVDEPSTLGLMFGGLGLVGMIAYRARKA